MTLQRKTPLTSRSPLRRAPLKPRSKRMRRTAVKARERAIQARRATRPSKAIRLLVIDRALGCCEICGVVLFLNGQLVGGAYSLHHRRPRGMGGSSRPEINSPANLLLLCGHATTPGGCHAHVEENRARAYEHGWLVPAGADPARVPVLLEGSDFYLHSDDGHRTPIEEQH